MGLVNRVVDLVVSPSDVTPRQSVRATVTADEPIDEVRFARLDWGYVNFYAADQAGANDGGRGGDDWVSVIAEDVPIAGAEFTGASSTFRVPSWAPASSAAIARWECRLRIDRDGRDVDARGVFAVAIGTADVEAYTEPLEVIAGAQDGTGTVIDLTLSSPVCRAGESITGQVTLTPTIDLPDGDLAVSWQRELESHPLTGTPAPVSPLDGRIMMLGKGIPLRASAPVVLPFEIALPADASPTAAAVHSSINWFVQARLTYAGLTGHPLERVRRPIVVVNAP